VPKEATFFDKITSEHYFLNESNLNLTNKRSRLRMNQGVIVYATLLFR